MSFAAAVDDRWFEDYVPGAVHEFGAMTVEEDEVLAFGRRFDRRCSTPTRRRRSGRSTAG
ncbi:MAG TPA: hypothetical protein VGX50_16160 [Longimicrobium sp.]|jgi:hypothetical protein|nr:hypothetical protein [Longimicrobium sp.]